MPMQLEHNITSDKPTKNFTKKIESTTLSTLLHYISTNIDLSFICTIQEQSESTETKPTIQQRNQTLE